MNFDALQQKSQQDTQHGHAANGHVTTPDTLQVLAANGEKPTKTHQNPPKNGHRDTKPRLIDALQAQYGALRHAMNGDADPIRDLRKNLTPEHFQDSDAQTIARALWALYEANKTFDGVAIGQYLQEANEKEAFAVLFADVLPTPERAPDFRDCVHTVLNWKKAAASTSAIPAPQLTNENGGREYAPRQIVALLYPKWQQENITSQAAHARRIRDALGDVLRYCPQLGWLGYDGARWATDDKHATSTAEHAASLGTQVSEESAALFDFAATLAREGRASDADAMSRAATSLLKHAKQCETRSFVDGALHFAAGDKTKIRVTHEVFDQKPWVIGFQNGTWARGKWREHRRDDYLMHLSPVALDAKADRSEWLQVLARMTGEDDDFARSLQDTAGYILAGASHLRFLPWAYGPKGTGKSTFTELLQTVLGSVAATVDPKMLSQDASRERLGAMLWNKRMAVCAEAGNQRIDADLLKTLSGADTLTVRFLYREPFDAPPRHVLVMVANDPPQVNAYDEALKDRVVALPFVHPLGEGKPFELTGGARIEAVRQDARSPLVRGFAAWAIEGLARVHQIQTIHRAACIETATAQFWADADPITPFWETVEESELCEGIAKSLLRGRYEEWCKSEGVNRPLNRSQWVKACNARGLVDKKSMSTRLWHLPLGTQGTQLSQFPEKSREKENEIRGLSENKPSCVPCVPKDALTPVAYGND